MTFFNNNQHFSQTLLWRVFNTLGSTTSINRIGTETFEKYREYLYIQHVSKTNA